MKLTIIMFLLLSNTYTFQIKPITSKKISKVSYTKIYDISHKAPIRIRRMEPFVFRLVKQIHNLITNYINETYAMASFPLSYNFAVKINSTNTK